MYLVKIVKRPNEEKQKKRLDKGYENLFRSRGGKKMLK